MLKIAYNPINIENLFWSSYKNMIWSAFQVPKYRWWASQTLRRAGWIWSDWRRLPQRRKVHNSYITLALWDFKKNSSFFSEPESKCPICWQLQDDPESPCAFCNPKKVIVDAVIDFSATANDSSNKWVLLKAQSAATTEWENPTKSLIFAKAPSLKGSCYSLLATVTIWTYFGVFGFCFGTLEPTSGIFP